MAGETGDILRLTDKQSLFGQVVLNVYFYRINSGSTLEDGYLNDLCTFYRDDVMSAITPMQSHSLSHQGLYAENLTNGIDILNFVDGFPVTGDDEDEDCMPPYVSWGFQLLRESRATRNGYKRYAGVPEGVVTDGVRTGLDTEVAALEVALAADWRAGLVVVGTPVILKHPFVVPLVAPVYSEIGSAQYRAVGTQNTRKFGRGV